MCGIVGFVNYKQNLLNYKKILQNMNNSLSKRGPDEEGYYLKEHVGLAHRRLIVIDPIGGKQPMISSKTEKKHSEIVITYNGQIYNTNELRKTLEENGFTFTSYSDFLWKGCCTSLEWYFLFRNLGFRKRRTFYG